MNRDSVSKRVQNAVLVVVFLLLVTVLAYRFAGTNWAAGAGTVVACGLWLWSARRSYREQAPESGARLVVDRSGTAADEERSRSSYRRIRIFNAGGRPLTRVEVTLVGCEPTPPWFQPVRMQRMHGGPHPFQLPPRAEVFVDLVALPHGHSEFILIADSSVHGDVPNGVAIQPLELTVRVTAQGLSPMAAVFSVSRSPSGALRVAAKAD